jgi:hypothetical protein
MMTRDSALDWVVLSFLLLALGWWYFVQIRLFSTAPSQ